MNSVDLSIIQSFQYIANKKNRGYCESSQLKVLSFLQKYYNTVICRRTLNYHLRALEDGAFIRRIRRHKRGPDGKILFHTTVNILKSKALKFLAQLAHWFKKIGWSVRTSADVEKQASRSEFQLRMIESYRQHVFRGP